MLSALPSVEVIHRCAATPVRIRRVFMVGMMASMMVSPDSFVSENASSMVTLSICLPWPAILVMAIGLIVLPFVKLTLMPPLENRNLRTFCIRRVPCISSAYSLKWSSASLPVCAA